MLNELYSSLEEDFEKAQRALARDLATVRTGRANPALLDRIRLDYYGTPTPLNQMAAVKVPEPRLLMVQPFDKSMLAAIERAINASDLGLNPANDGNVIRISIPPLTRERREEMVKIARKHGEDAKVASRNARRDCNDMIKSMQKDGDLSEDEARRATAHVQDLTDKATGRIDELVAAKVTELTDG